MANLNSGVLYPQKQPQLNAGVMYPAKPAAQPVLNSGVLYPKNPGKPVLNAGVTNSPPAKTAGPAWKTNVNGYGGGVAGHVGRPDDPFSLQNTGQGEDAFQKNQDKFWNTATPANAVWDFAQGAYADRAPQTSYATDAYNRFSAGSPNADLNGYYDRARQKTGEALNTQAAATGQLGSTAGNNMFGEGMAALGAEQANREAQYGLDWNAQNFGMASGADRGGLMRDQSNQSWLGALAGAGFGADSAGLNRLNSGLAASQDAQGAREHRVNSMLGSLMGYSSGVNDQLGGLYQDFRSEDQNALDTMIQIMMGKAVDRRNVSQNVGEDWNKDTEHVANTATSWIPGGGASS